MGAGLIADFADIDLECVDSAGLKRRQSVAGQAFLKRREVRGARGFKDFALARDCVERHAARYILPRQRPRGFQMVAQQVFTSLSLCKSRA